MGVVNNTNGRCHLALTRTRRPSHLGMLQSLEGVTVHQSRGTRPRLLYMKLKKINNALAKYLEALLRHPTRVEITHK
jgi:hypothetical protein